MLVLPSQALVRYPHSLTISETKDKILEKANEQMANKRS
jgi:hypothetical protein